MPSDNDDAAVFDSAVRHDATLDLNGNVMQSLLAIREGCFDSVSTLDTTHVLSSIRVDIAREESDVSVICTAIAQHYRHG